MRYEDGGERGIRTLDGLLTHTPLAGERLRPLGHLSEGRKFSMLAAETQGLVVALSAILGLGLEPRPDLFSMHGDVFRCINAHPNLVTFHGQNGHLDAVADEHRLSHLSRQNQHPLSPQRPAGPSSPTNYCFME
ncbi:MAG: hypothetical protein RLZZ174_2065 [Pseudomonadota bacterium]